MALAVKKSEAVHTRNSTSKAALKASFDAGAHTPLEEFPGEAALIYQMQQMQEDIDELRRYIVSSELLLATSGGSLPTRVLASGFLWNDRGTVKIG